MSDAPSLTTQSLFTCQPPKPPKYLGRSRRLSPTIQQEPGTPLSFFYRNSKMRYPSALLRSGAWLCSRSRSDPVHFLLHGRHRHVHQKHPRHAACRARRCNVVEVRTAQLGR